MDREPTKRDVIRNLYELMEYLGRNYSNPAGPDKWPLTDKFALEKIDSLKRAIMWIQEPPKELCQKI